MSERKQRFELEFIARVREVDDRGYSVNSSSGLEVKDTLVLGPLNFMGVAGVLAQFHSLATKLATEKETT